MRIGLMGGTFDPIHFGHLFIAEAAAHFAQLDEVWWLPNGSPPHREGKEAMLPAETRAEMVRLAIASNPRFRLCLIEVERGGRSYTVETLRDLTAQHPDFHWHWIAGADTVADLVNWFQIDEVLKLARFVAVSRPGQDLQEAREVLQQRFAPWQNERVAWLEAPGLHIASRDLRARLRADLPTRYLIPEEVRAFIEERALYRAPSST
jgi:nicotinate-nucleotide adenylyltransferase